MNEVQMTAKTEILLQTEQSRYLARWPPHSNEFSVPRSVSVQILTCNTYHERSLHWSQMPSFARALRTSTDIVVISAMLW